MVSCHIQDIRWWGLTPLQNCSRSHLIGQSFTGDEWKQVYRTFLSILADLTNVVVWMVSTRSLISKSPSPFINPLVTVPRAKSRFLSFFSFSFNFTLWSSGTEKSTILQVFFFLSGRLAEIRRSVWILKSQRSSYVSFFWKYSGLCIYRLFVWSNLNFLHSSQWVTLPTQPILVLFSFFANLLHSLIMWLIDLSLSPHNLHLQFCCVLCILA